MSENNEIKDMKLDESMLDEVSGGVGGKVLKTYEYGHKLKINGITTDGEWYRLLCYHPEGGTCYGFIYKKYTERI